MVRARQCHSRQENLYQSINDLLGVLILIWGTKCSVFRKHLIGNSESMGVCGQK